MSKKTAAQKGYRKTQKKKPFLTKGELIGSIIILVIFIIVLVFMLNDDLFHLFYNDGSVAASEVKDGDIVSYFSKDSKKRYAPIGTANEIEGMTRTVERNSANVPFSYSYTPAEITDNLERVSLSGTYVAPAEIVSQTIEYFGNVEDPGSKYIEPIDITVQGHEGKLFSYNYSYYDASRAAAEETAETAEAAAETTEAAAETTEAAAETTEAVEATEATAETAEQADNYFCQNISVYVTADNGHSIVMHIYRSSSDDSFYFTTAEEISAYAEQFYNYFTVNGTEKAA